MAIVPLVVTSTMLWYTYTEYNASLLWSTDQGFSFNVINFFWALGSMVVFGWGFDAYVVEGAGLIMKSWCVAGWILVAAMYYWNVTSTGISTNPIANYFIALCSEFLGTGSFIWALSACAFIAKHNDTNTFTAFWFWAMAAEAL